MTAPATATTTIKKIIIFIIADTPGFLFPVAGGVAEAVLAVLSGGVGGVGGVGGAGGGVWSEPAPLTGPAPSTGMSFFTAATGVLSTGVSFAGIPAVSFELADASFAISFGFSGGVAAGSVLTSVTGGVVGVGDVGGAGGAEGITGSAGTFTGSAGFSSVTGAGGGVGASAGFSSLTGSDGSGVVAGGVGVVVAGESIFVSP